MIRVGMSTTCVHSRPLDETFELAAAAGFDGVEVMITHDPRTRDAALLRRLSERHGQPILSIHAPVLVRTQLIWGTSPHAKLARSAELAVRVGASTVVVHPPFRWQPRTIAGFARSVRTISREFGVEIAVENMFAFNVRGRRISAFAPSWNPADLDCDAATLDFSHASIAGVDSLDLATRLGDRLRHVHLCDGIDEPGRAFDEHLVPGEGTQPVAEVLQLLASRGWEGSLVAEVKTSGAASEEERLDMLRRTIAFARQHTCTPSRSDAEERPEVVSRRP
ncbi:MAG: sugar phosphate isomerase/epimerase [Naasia sp.]